MPLVVVATDAGDFANERRYAETNGWIS